MCEILVHLGHIDSGDPEIENSRYKFGDIVVIKEDGHTWGSMETKAAWTAAGRNPADWDQPFFLIKVPGLTVAKVESLLEEDATLIPLADGFEKQINKRRKRKFDIDSASLALKAAKDTDGQVTLTLAQAKAVKHLFINKDDGLEHDMGL